MRIPTKEDMTWMQSIEPIWQYDERYNNFYIHCGFNSIIIDTDEALDNEIECIKQQVAEDFFLM